MLVWSTRNHFNTPPDEIFLTNNRPHQSLLAVNDELLHGAMNGYPGAANDCYKFRFLLGLAQTSGTPPDTCFYAMRNDFLSCFWLQYGIVEEQVPLHLMVKFQYYPVCGYVARPWFLPITADYTSLNNRRNLCYCSGRCSSCSNGSCQPFRGCVPPANV